MTRDPFEDQLSRLLAVDPSTDFTARLRSALMREPRPSRVPSLLFAIAAISIAALMIAVSLSLRELPIVERTTPPVFSGADKHLRVESAERVLPTAHHKVVRSAAPVRANRSESIPPVIISAEDTQAFQRLVRYITEQELVMSLEEATSQRVSNELVLEEGDVQ